MERYEKLAEEPEILTEDQSGLREMSREMKKIFREIGSSMENTIRYESFIAALFEDELEIYRNDEDRSLIRGRMESDFADLGMNAKERIDVLVRLFGSQKLFEIGLGAAEMRDLIAKDVRSIIVLLVRHINELPDEADDAKQQMEDVKEFLKILMNVELKTVTNCREAKEFKRFVAERLARDVSMIPLHVSAKFPTELLNEIFHACYRNNYPIGEIDLWATLVPTNDFRTAEHPVKLALRALDLRENNPEEYIRGGYGELAKSMGYVRLAKQPS